MLSGEQMDRIREEENFRQEARKELKSKEPAVSFGGKTWKLLNSSFALWFLSSVVLAGLTWAFTEYQGYASQEKAKEALKERLSTEIAFRISNAIAQNKLDTKRLNSGEQFSTYSLFSTDFDYLNNEVYDRNATPPYQIDYSVFPEYKNRTFRSLLRELRNTVGKEDIKHLHDADDEYIKLEDIVDAANLKNGNLQGAK